MTGILIWSSVAFREIPSSANLGFSPHNLLAKGDEALLVAPEASFSRELARLNLGESPFPVAPESGSLTTDSGLGPEIDAELGDLRQALKTSKVPEERAEQIVNEYTTQRRLLRDYLSALADVASKRNYGESSVEQANPAKPKAPKMHPTEGLPEEFADYLEGAFSWHDAGIEAKAVARRAWERLLAKPPAQRRFKSTWAAFMLGRSWQDADAEKALSFFQEVRKLRREGFADSTGMAAASFGLEGRILFKKKHYEQALELYLEQLAAGDPTATNSLLFVAAEAAGAPDQVLKQLALNPKTRRVMTSYFISHPPELGADSNPDDPQNADAGPNYPVNATSRWLKAIGLAKVQDANLAADFALAAYQANELEVAQHWIKVAGDSPVAHWLQAKLLLRLGKVQAARVAIDRTAQALPLQPHWTNQPPPVALKDTLFVRSGWFPIDRRVHAELGVFQLAQGEYAQALDSLLNAGFWVDAAYVAERVLSLDELKNYVDAHWPAVSSVQEDQEDAEYGYDASSPRRLRREIRHLLARRLTRQFRAGEAQEYYPPDLQEDFECLVRSLDSGWNTALPNPDRAAALFQAALITRTNGLELVGTEVAPDWHLLDGQGEGDITVFSRATNAPGPFLLATQDELLRALRNKPDPDVRFHYRYQAAALALEASHLMPNDDHQNAYILWQAGSWLKNRDPQTADLFYKSLVRRNRQTSLGAEAARIHWFPKVDDNGNIIPRAQLAAPVDSGPVGLDELAPESISSNPDAGPVMLDLPSEPTPNSGSDSIVEMPPETSSSELETTYMPGVLPNAEASESPGAYEYTIKSGDTLLRVAAAFAQAGVVVTLNDILQANPGLDASRLAIGQVIVIPASSP